MCFPTTSLPVCQYSRIIAEETSQNQILDTYVKDILLPSSNIKNLIESKCTIFPYDKLIILLIAFDADAWTFN